MTFHTVTVGRLPRVPMTSCGMSRVLPGWSLLGRDLRCLRNHFLRSSLKVDWNPFPSPTVSVVRLVRSSVLDRLRKHLRGEQSCEYSGKGHPPRREWVSFSCREVPKGRPRYSSVVSGVPCSTVVFRHVCRPLITSVVPLSYLRPSQRGRNVFLTLKEPPRSK